MTWAMVIAGVALLFSIACFYLFFVISTAKPVPEQVVDAAAKRAEVAGVNPATLAALAKALAEAFSKVGPAALALIGAILFLLLSGAASGVYKLTDGRETNTQAPQRDRAVKDGQGNRSDASGGNGSGEAGNRVGSAA